MIRQPVFVDTGFWAALLNTRDKHYAAASLFYSNQADLYLVFSSEAVLFETLTYLNCALKRHDLASEFYRRISLLKNILLPSTERNTLDAFDIFFRYKDVSLSMTDCLSFAMMRRHGIQFFLGFDGHFRMMGFKDVVAEFSRI